MPYQSTRGSVLYLIVVGMFVLALSIPLGIIVVGIGVIVHCRHHGKQAQEHHARQAAMRQKLVAQQESRQASAVRSLTRGL